MSPEAEKIPPELMAEVAKRFDSWINFFTGLGVDGRDQRLASSYQLRDEIDVEQIYAMYAQSKVFARIIDVVPEHATRRWIKVSGSMVEGAQPDEDFGRAVMDALDELDAREKCYELMRLDRLEGGAAIVLGADDGQKVDKELNPERIKEVRYLNVVSRSEIFPGPLNRNPMSPHFREPEYYTFGGITAEFGGSTLAAVH